MSATGQAEQPDATAEQPHPVRRVAGWLASLVLAVAVGGAIAVAGIPAVTGAKALTVLSGSMAPTLPVGTVAVVHRQPIDQVKAGDIITYTDRDPDSSTTRTVTHRVVSVQRGPEGLSFHTKGDANDTLDQRPTAAADVQGVLWYSVPLAGWLRELLISPAGLAYLAGVVLLMVAAHLVLPKTRQPARGHVGQGPQ